MATSDQRVIATAGLVSVGVGSANSIFKNERLPSSRFLIGSGVAYLILSAMSEAAPDLAKGLAMGITSTIVLGEGGGLLGYIDQRGEGDTQPKKRTQGDRQPGRTSVGDAIASVVPNPNGAFRFDTVSPIPGIAPTRPAATPTTRYVTVRSNTVKRPPNAPGPGTRGNIWGLPGGRWVEQRRPT